MDAPKVPVFNCEKIISRLGAISGMEDHKIDPLLLCEPFSSAAVLLSSGSAKEILQIIERLVYDWGIISGMEDHKRIPFTVDTCKRFSL